MIARHRGRDALLVNRCEQVPSLAGELWEQRVASSNPAAPTKIPKQINSLERKKARFVRAFSFGVTDYVPDVACSGTTLSGASMSTESSSG